MTHNRRQVIAGASVMAMGRTLEAYAGPASSRSIIIVGDWGRDSAPYQRDVARQMDSVAGKMDCAGVISVGDNFYEDGVQSVDDVKWRTSFEDIYCGPNLKSLPWFVALGNHDYGGVPQAQVDYTQHSDRWYMPARYFKIGSSQLGVPDTDLFVIDTNALIAENFEGNGRMAVNLRSQDASAQLAWLERELASSSVRHKLVAGHHPIFSGGSLHGDTPDLIRTLLPMFKQHGVSAYLAGHDHDLQHIKFDGLHCICAGAGCEARPVRMVNGTQFCASSPGFGILKLASDRLELQFRDNLGKILYRSLLS